MDIAALSIGMSQNAVNTAASIALLKMQMNTGEETSNNLLEMAKSRETVILDEDGTMMYVSYVKTLGGSAAWAAGTKPEDYYK